MPWHIYALMKDSTELSFHTAKRAHTIVLQEIERGRFDWKNSDMADKIRSRKT